MKSCGERIGDERLPDDFLEKYGEMEGVQARSTNAVGGQGLWKKRRLRVFKIVHKVEAVDETMGRNYGLGLRAEAAGDTRRVWLISTVHAYWGLIPWLVIFLD